MQIPGNPIIKHKFTPDPTVMVYNGTVYLYTGHDQAPTGKEDYEMNEWLCFSSKDLQSWQEYPSPLRPTDFAWAKGDAYASKILHYRNKFYWFVATSPISIYGKAIGLAVSSTPTGPFEDAIGSPLITHDMLPPTSNEKANLDPTVLVDSDSIPYIFWGNGACYFAKLREDLRAIDGDIQLVPLPGFTEGAHIHKRKGWYYLAYGFEYPEKVAYAMSRSIHGPWEFKGILNEIAGNCETNRPAILDFKGNTYFFYHNGALPNGGSHRRSVCMDSLFYNTDDSLQKVIMTREGVAPSVS